VAAQPHCIGQGNVEPPPAPITGR